MDVHGNAIALVLSFLLIVFFYSVSLIIKNKKTRKINNVFLARKVLHIGVSNWAFIYFYLFQDKFLLPLLGLIFMAVVNLLVELKNKRNINENKVNSTNNFNYGINYGTIEYPLVMAFLLIFMQFFLKNDSNYYNPDYENDILLLKSFTSALLGMGYGDGLSAIIGHFYGKKLLPFSNDKTVLGSMVMFICVFIITIFFLNLSIISALFISFSASILEAYTPFKLDNITVPIGIFFLVLLLSK